MLPHPYRIVLVAALGVVLGLLILVAVHIPGYFPRTGNESASPALPPTGQLAPSSDVFDKEPSIRHLSQDNSPVSSAITCDTPESSGSTVRPFDATTTVANRPLHFQITLPPLWCLTANTSQGLQAFSPAGGCNADFCNAIIDVRQASSTSLTDIVTEFFKDAMTSIYDNGLAGAGFDLRASKELSIPGASVVQYVNYGGGLPAGSIAVVVSSTRLYEVRLGTDVTDNQFMLSSFRILP
jgi:hypothetical protein